MVLIISQTRSGLATSRILKFQPSLLFLNSGFLFRCRYLCDYTYYASLYYGHGRAAFIHVPPLSQSLTADCLGKALQTIILEMLKQCGEEREEDRSGKKRKWGLLRMQLPLKWSKSKDYLKPTQKGFYIPRYYWWNFLSKAEPFTSLASVQSLRGKPSDWQSVPLTIRRLLQILQSVKLDWNVLDAYS